VNQKSRVDGIADPLLAAAMEELRHEAPYNVDWERLRTSIGERAALPLARRRAPRKSFAARSAGLLAMAASVAFALWVGPDVYQNLFVASPAAEYTAIVDDDVLVEALTSDLSEQEMLRLVTGSPEVLLAVAIGPR